VTWWIRYPTAGAIDRLINGFRVLACVLLKLIIALIVLTAAGWRDAIYRVMVFVEPAME